jgi:hypothetical protein
MSLMKERYINPIVTSPISDDRERQLRTFVAAAKQHGNDGKGKDGLVGYARFVAKNYPGRFARSLNKIKAAQVRGGLGRDTRRPYGIKDTELSDAYLQAAEEIGSDGMGRGGADGYLTALAKKRPQQFARLLDLVLDDECAPGGPVEEREAEKKRGPSLKEYLQSSGQWLGECEKTQWDDQEDQEGDDSEEEDQEND